MIVGVQPDGERVAAFAVAGVEPGVGPLVGQSAVKPLHLSIGLRPVRASAPVLDMTECVAEGMRSVAGAVVGQDTFDLDPVAAEEADSATEEAGGGRERGVEDHARELGRKRRLIAQARDAEDPVLRALMRLLTVVHGSLDEIEDAGVAENKNGEKGDAK